MNGTAVPDDALAIHRFWFGTLTGGLADGEQRRRWFIGGPEFDASIERQFAASIAQAADGELDAWLDSAAGCLAFILVCDQFPRNVFRGTPQAFASDALALEVARNGIERGLDRELGWDERAFFYLPFEHSETLTDQHTAVGLYAWLRDSSPPEARPFTDDYLNHARQHRDIVLRFGRFPHRNRVLERESTAAELLYLETGQSYGQ